MSNIAKLKEKGRNLEAKSPAQAIETYTTILEQLEGSPELEAELPLYNKVGDLYQKLGKAAEAADTWEKAMNKYADGGFANNAIALCNKILRVAPGRTPVYLKLAQLMVARGLVNEAKQSFLEYADRMQKAGQLNQAFKALKEFADLSPNNQEIRVMLAEQLKAAARTDEARDQLAKLYAEAQASGDPRRSRATLSQIKAIDPSYDPEKDPKAKVPPKSQKSHDLVFLDLGDSSAPAAPPPPPPRPAAPPKRPSVAAPAPAPPPPPPPPPAPPPKPVAAPPPPKAPPVVQRPAAQAPPPTAAEEPKRGTGPFRRPSAAFVQPPAAAGPPKVNPFAARAAQKPPPAPKKEEPPPEEMAIERSSVEFSTPPEAAPVEGLDTGMNLDVGSIELEAPNLEVPAEAGGDLSLEVPEIDLGGDLQLTETSLELPDIAVPDVPVAPAATDIKALEAAVAEDPDDPGRHRLLGEALLEAGQRERGVQELDLAMSGWEAKEEWQTAQDLSDEILRLDANSIRHHQKRVEYAFRLGDRGNLINAYLELADAFFRSGATDRARTVYQRVLEHDAGNDRAVSALQLIEPAPPEPPAKAAAAAAPAKTGGGGSDFVDLGSFLDDDDMKVKGDARMRIQDEEPTGDEERDFQDMLSQFKKGIEQTVDAGDAQTHYDLGVAFKEMGLLDEAIAEFQKALQGKDMKNRASEALGVCFFDKGQPSVAATVLRRAIEGDSGSDDNKVGLLYWLGRCEEEQGKKADALTWYQRVFAVDIRFQDVNDRVKTLAKAGK